MTEKTRTCSKCEEVLPETNEYFYCKDKKKRTFHTYCKKCYKASSKNYYLKNKEKVSQRKIKHYEENKETILQKAAVYRKENAEQLREARQKRYKENKESFLESQKLYRSSPKYKNYKKAKNEREKKRLKEDPSYRMKKNVSRMVRLYLNKNKGTKKSRLWSALPYTPQELREHLENQFEEWMTWDNYGTGEGKWNIDHIHPQSLLPYDSLEHPNFLKCWELNNLRPLCSLENISKGNKIIR